MNRPWIWLQLLIGWSPLWAFFVALLLTAHPGTSPGTASLIALRLIVTAAILGLFVQRWTRGLPWPHPMRSGFVARHLIAAILYATAWLLFNSLVASALHRQLVLVVGIGIGPYLVTGVWLYAMVAGVIYADQAARRSARMEALAARSQLEALRAQLHPHFLFNALHTVVQLIPNQPDRAVQAAERIGALLRTAIEEDRDVVLLAEEWAFVERYLEIERIRFGDRLRLEVDLSAAARRAELPSFALQTLVENAVRHGVMPRVEPTRVDIRARLADGLLHLTVHDTGTGADRDATAADGGTGLARLGERLRVLYGDRARLEIVAPTAGDFTVSLVVPQLRRRVE